MSDGWRTDSARDRKLVPVADEQLTIQRMGALRDEGKSIRETIKVLEDDEIRPKRGGTWHPTTIRRILSRSTD